MEISLTIGNGKGAGRKRSKNTGASWSGSTSTLLVSPFWRKHQVGGFKKGIGWMQGSLVMSLFPQVIRTVWDPKCWGILYHVQTPIAMKNIEDLVTMIIVITTMNPVIRY